MNNSALPLVTYEQAKRLKAAGYNRPCLEYFICDLSGEIHHYLDRHYINHYYDPNPPKESSADWFKSDRHWHRPTVALALKWIRDTKNIRYSLAIVAQNHYFRVVESEVIGNVVRPSERIKLAKTYEQAESALLDELLTLIENERQ